MRIEARVWLLLFLAANAIACNSAAASGFSDQVKRIPDDLASPVTTPAYIPLAVGAGLTGFFLLTRSSISDPATRSVAASKPLGSSSKIGDLGGQMLPNGAYALGQLIAYGAGNENAGSRALMMTLASLYSGGVTTILKYATSETRPDGSNRRSFPSGHASDAFSFASVVGAEHELPWAICAYGLAGFVGYSRLNDNKHYLHDVIAGATIGIAYGIGMHYRYKAGGSAYENARVDENRKSFLRKLRFDLAPLEDGAAILAHARF